MISILAALALAAASPAPADATPGIPGDRTCMRLGSGSSTHFYPVDDHTILVSAGLRAYRITTNPSSLLADRSNVIETNYPISTVVCAPQDLTLRVSGPSGRDGLIVQSIEPLSREMAEDLRKGGPRRR